jgi:hypothetical protein
MRAPAEREGGAMRAARHRRGSARVVELYRLRATPAVDGELYWFFNLAESEMGPESNFDRLLSAVSAERQWHTTEDQAEATHAHRRILGWLRAMPNHQAGVLQATYEPRDWPLAVRAEFGRLSGVAVRLTCPRDEWPEDRRSQEAMDMTRARDLEARCIGQGTDVMFLERLRKEADLRLEGAFGAYLKVRGTGPCIVRAF